MQVKKMAQNPEIIEIEPIPDPWWHW